MIKITEQFALLVIMLLFKPSESEMTNAKPESKQVIELTPEELETVSGGGKSSGGNTSGQIFLVFKFKLVAVK